MKHEGHEFLTLLVAGNLFADSVDGVRVSKHKDVIRRRLKKGINDTLEALEKDCKPMYKLVYALPEMDEYYNTMVKAAGEMTEVIVETPVEKWPELFVVMKAFQEGKIKLQEDEPQHS
jgi:hypothetical protein